MKTNDIKKLAQAYVQVVEGKQPQFEVPEGLDKEGVAHFMGKAAAAHKAGKKSFEMGGKTYPVTIKPGHPAGKVAEATEDNPANYQHLCAKQVTHESWGAGNCIPEMHAEATAEGHVEWYDVMFEHGIEKQVPISELKVVRAESHMHSKKGKKMSEAEDKTTPCPDCKGSMENHDPDCERMKKEGWDDMLKAVKDKQKEKGTGNFDKKKVSTGTVFTRKTNKDGTSKGVKEGIEWEVFKRIMEKKDAHKKGAVPPEAIDSKMSKSEKDFVDQHGGYPANKEDKVEYDDDKWAKVDTAKAVASVKVAPKRPGDQTIGDKTPPKAK